MLDVYVYQIYAYHIGREYVLVPQAEYLTWAEYPSRCCFESEWVSASGPFATSLNAVIDADILNESRLSQLRVHWAACLAEWHELCSLLCWVELCSGQPHLYLASQTNTHKIQVKVSFYGAGSALRATARASSCSAEPALRLLGGLRPPQTPHHCDRSPSYPFPFIALHGWHAWSCIAPVRWEAPSGPPKVR